MDQDSLISIAEDLEYLFLWGSDISNADIRRGTAILRRLLVEDAYGLAWRAIGESKQPTLHAIDLSLLIGNDAHKVVYALAGGAIFRGMQIAIIVVNHGNNAIGGMPPEAIREDGYPFERIFTLSEYLSSASGLVHGKYFNRRELIKYLANVKGGVHLSPQQRKAEQKLIDRIGKIEKKLMVHNSDGLLVEAVACAQGLGNSEDAQHFIKKIRSLQIN